MRYFSSRKSNVHLKNFEWHWCILNWIINENWIWVHIIKLIILWSTQEIQNARHHNFILPNLEQNIPLKKITELRNIVHNILIDSGIAALNIKIDLRPDCMHHNFQTFNVFQKLVFTHARRIRLSACLNIHLNGLLISKWINNVTW